MFAVAAIGMSDHDRRPQDVADDEHLAVVPAVDQACPAIGLKSRFGSVAATNTSAIASGESVTTNTMAARATWWTRSPNSEMSWPDHSALNEPLSARRT